MSPGPLPCCCRCCCCCCCCCCLHIKTFFLPNDISSTPSVLPDSSSSTDTDSVVTDSETEKNQALNNLGKQINC